MYADAQSGIAKTLEEEDQQVQCFCAPTDLTDAGTNEDTSSVSSASSIDSDAPLSSHLNNLPPCVWRTNDLHWK